MSCNATEWESNAHSKSTSHRSDHSNCVKNQVFLLHICHHWRSKLIHNMCFVVYNIRLIILFTLIFKNCTRLLVSMAYLEIIPVINDNITCTKSSINFVFLPSTCWKKIIKKKKNGEHFSSHFVKFAPFKKILKRAMFECCEHFESSPRYLYSNGFKLTSTYFFQYRICSKTFPSHQSKDGP